MIQLIRWRKGEQKLILLRSLLVRIQKVKVLRIGIKIGGRGGGVMVVVFFKE